MDDSEIAKFEKTTLDFAIECPLKEIPKSAVRNMSTKVSSQKLNGSLLDVALAVSGDIASQDYAKKINSIIIVCFRDDYQKLSDRLQVSLSSKEPGSPSGGQGDNKFNLIFLCAGIGSAVIALVVAVLLSIRRRKKQSAKHSPNLNSFDFVTEPRPQLHSFSQNEGESGLVTQTMNNIPAPQQSHDELSSVNEKGMGPMFQNT